MGCAAGMSIGGQERQQRRRALKPLHATTATTTNPPHARLQVAQVRLRRLQHRQLIHDRRHLSRQSQPSACLAQSGGGLPVGRHRSSTQLRLQLRSLRLQCHHLRLQLRQVCRWLLKLLPCAATGGLLLLCAVGASPLLLLLLLLLVLLLLLRVGRHGVVAVGGLVVKPLLIGLQAVLLLLIHIGLLGVGMVVSAICGSAIGLVSIGMVGIGLLLLTVGAARSRLGRPAIQLRRRACGHGGGRGRSWLGHGGRRAHCC